MPARLPIPGRRTAYFDWSTFVYAFDGTGVAVADKASRRLATIVLDVARDANLCFSLTHVWELLHREDRGERLAMAAWLENLPLVWLLPEAEVIEGEIRHAVLDVARGTRTKPLLPALPSFLSVFTGWDPTSASFGRALCTPTIVALVEELGDDAGNKRRLEQFRSLSVEAAKHIYIDRSLALNERGRDRIDADLDAKLRVGLEADALRIAAELRCRPGSEFHFMRAGMFVSPSDEEVRSALAGFPDLRLLPYHFLWHRTFRNMSYDVTKRENIRSSAFDRQRGDYYDLAHLVGAAYCDVFTCDAAVAKRLNGGREALGRAPPITAEGGIEALVRRIEEQLGRL
jgi:hypothetical protein